MPAPTPISFPQLSSQGRSPFPVDGCHTSLHSESCLYSCICSSSGPLFLRPFPFPSHAVFPLCILIKHVGTLPYSLPATGSALPLLGSVFFNELSVFPSLLTPHCALGPLQPAFCSHYQCLSDTYHFLTLTISYLCSLSKQIPGIIFDFSFPPSLPISHQY